MLTNYAIVLASGTGSRYGGNVPKQFEKIAGRTILEHTLDVFEKSDYTDKIVLVITPEYREKAEQILSQNNYKKLVKILNGGEQRKDSSYIGVSSIEETEANVFIHDCARPFVTERIIKECAEALNKYKAVNVAVQSTDTIYTVKNSFIESIPERKYLMRAQTPQCFKLSVIKKAHELSKNDNNFTDDCGLVVKYKLADVYIVEGDIENIKITYPSDIYLAERIYAERFSD